MLSSPIWFPYAQMKTIGHYPVVESAEGASLYLSDGTRLIDGIASWWCAIHGYRHPELDRAASDQLKRMAHVMLGGLVHSPAIDLAEKLVEITPAGLNHVFFGDSGSVGVRKYMYANREPRRVIGQYTVLSPASSSPVYLTSPTTPTTVNMGHVVQPPL